MKKKGLIIATIVMVLVLAVSLTTATYAWFSANSVTKLNDFNVSVTANNAVNIGFDADGVIKTTAITANDFKTGSVSLAALPDAGSIASTWTGTNGLSATVDHNILWGSQSTAVAAQYSASTISSATAVKTDKESIGSVLAKKAASNASYANYKIVKANEKDEDTLENNAFAIANRGHLSNDVNGDFVYMVLGVQPNGTADLATNNLCIAVDWSSQSGATLGVLASLHVAYRVTLANTEVANFTNNVWDKTATTGDWQDVDIFDPTGTTGYNSATPSDGTGHPVTNIINGTASTPDYKKAYTDTYGAAPTDYQYMYAITGLSTKIGVIDQIELIIYMDGTDTDCDTSGITNISGALKIFFCNTIDQVDA